MSSKVCLQLFAQNDNTRRLANFLNALHFNNVIDLVTKKILMSIYRLWLVGVAKKLLKDLITQN